MENSKLDKRRWVTLLWQMIIGTTSSFVYVLSVFISPLVELRGWAPGSILFVFTLSMWVGTPSNIIGGIILQKIKPKRLIVGGGAIYGLAILISAFVTSVVLFSVLQGIIASFFMFVIMLAQYENIGKLFPDRRGFAIGIVLGGMGLGSAIVAPIAQYITERASVVASIGGQGVAYGIIMVLCGLLLIEAPKDYMPKGWDASKFEENIEGERIATRRGPNVQWYQMIKTPIFWITMCALILINIVGAMPISNGAYMSQLAVGATEAQGAWILSIITIACAIGNAVGGMVADKFGDFQALAIVGILNVVSAAVCASVGLGHLEIWTCALALAGLDYGALTTIMPVFSMNIFGEKNFGINYGILGVNAMVVTSVAPQLSIMKNMAHTMWIGACMALAGTILAVLAIKISRNYVIKAWEKFGAE